MSSPNSYAQALTPSVMVYEDRAFGRELGLEELMRVGPPRWDPCPCKKRHQRSLLQPLTVSPTHALRSREPHKQRGRWQPPTSQEKRPQNEANLAGTWILEFSVSRLQNKFPLSKPLSLWQPKLTNTGVENNLNIAYCACPGITYTKHHLLNTLVLKEKK